MVSKIDCYLDKKSRLSRKMYLKYVKSLSLKLISHYVSFALRFLQVRVTPNPAFSSREVFTPENGFHQPQYCTWLGR